ncbi:glycosyltransferase [Stutzerimonas frequens]|uniref:glycosyltransferase n=1 Tax=Stutzerimonas frequens TaxID=2968969 RepID=UPI00190BBCCA|nr:glycosyltransferase [Stutzerimonas frequens]MBK3871217.1 glycosyltransferase [Stutzerimonas frequens]MBK3909554.1 glycosyltransferase [Stutzerimonas frequens]MBK3928873.1 glycosyltransferase [Stutzerimonas frequens]
MSDDLVSFLVPVRNEELFIRESIESVLAVSDINIELIIVDDGSTDSTADIIRSIGDKRVKFIDGGGNGKVAALNLAYSVAQGSAFILFAGDDILVPQVVLDRVRPCLLNKQAPVVSLCKVKMFSDNKKFNGVVVPKDPQKGALTGGGMAFNHAFAKLIFPVPDILPNEDTWIGAFVEFYPCDTIHVPKVGLMYRIHQGNSMRRDVRFSEFSAQLRRRESASKLFLQLKGDSLSSGSRETLAQRWAAQDDRYNGRSTRILFYSCLSIRERISLFFYSNALLYSLRQRFYSFFSGR